MIKALVDIVQTWSGDESLRIAMQLAGGLVVTLLVKSLVPGTLQALSMLRLSEIGAYELERLVLEKTMKVPLVVLESPHNKDSRIRALRASLVDVVIEGLDGLRQAALALILTIILSSYGNWSLALISWCVLIIPLRVHSGAAEGMEQLARKQTESRRLLDYLTGLMTQSKSAREIRLFGLQDHLKERWRTLLQHNSAATVRLGVRGEVAKIAPDLVMALIGGGISVAVLLTVQGKGRPAGDFALLFQASAMFPGLFQGLVALGGRFKAMAMQVEDLEAYLGLPEEERTTRRGDNRKSTLLGLRVESLTFAYPDSDRPAIRDVSFSVSAGQRVAIVGENGSGKSTLVKLILGLYPLSAGVIQWLAPDGPRTWAEVRDHISVVFQDFAKLLFTVRENVALGRIQKLNEDSPLLTAMERAEVADDFPDLNEQIGAAFGGREPSGGQWQRLATARSYVRDGMMIFFDEPTAALDPKSEAKAFETFMDLAHGHSALLVTHRLGAARLADSILVMKDGALVEQGRHQDLVRAGGEYERLYRLQAGWYE